MDCPLSLTTAVFHAFFSGKWGFYSKEKMPRCSLIAFSHGCSPHLGNARKLSRVSPASQSMSGMVCGAKACTEIFGLPWGTLGFLFPLHSHAAFVNLSITPSHSCHQCPMPFPTARQVLCPSYPCTFLFLSRTVLGDHPASLLWRFPFSAQPVGYKSRGQAAESMGESLVWPVSMIETSSERQCQWICSTFFQDTGNI